MVAIGGSVTSTRVVFPEPGPLGSNDQGLTLSGSRLGPVGDNYTIEMVFEFDEVDPVYTGTGASGYATIVDFKDRTQDEAFVNLSGAAEFYDGATNPSGPAVVLANGVDADVVITRTRRPSCSSATSTACSSSASPTPTTSPSSTRTTASSASSWTTSSGRSPANGARQRGQDQDLQRPARRGRRAGSVQRRQRPGRHRHHAARRHDRPGWRDARAAEYDQLHRHHQQRRRQSRQRRRPDDHRARRQRPAAPCRTCGQQHLGRPRHPATRRRPRPTRPSAPTPTAR